MTAIDSMILSINPAAIVDAGSNDSICEGSTYTLSGVMGGSASSITWTTSGSGTFDNDTLLSATYTPSVSDITAGNVTLTITTNDPDGLGPCPTITDDMILTINLFASVDAGVDDT